MASAQATPVKPTGGAAMYRKGAARERQVEALLWAAGWVAYRSAASQSPCDIIALKAGEIPHAVQVKAGKGPPFSQFGPAQRDALRTWAARAGALPVYCYWPPHRPLHWYAEEEWPEPSKRGQPDYLVDDNGCWLWQKSTVDGYGRCRRSGVQVMAHRWYYEEAVGPIPEGLELDHLCHVRACVNPDHLEPVTRVENIRRTAVAKLSVEDVEAIRASPEGSTKLAARYGVGREWIWRLRTGVCWKDAL